MDDLQYLNKYNERIQVIEVLNLVINGWPSILSSVC